MSDSDEDCYGDESVQATRIRHALEYEVEENEKQIKRLNAALEEQRLLAGMYQAELEAQRERAEKSEKAFDRLLKAIYDVLYDRNNIFYNKIFRFFEGHTD